MNDREKPIGISWWDILRALAIPPTIFLTWLYLKYFLHCWNELNLGGLFSNKEANLPPAIMMILAVTLLPYASISGIIISITALFNRGYKKQRVKETIKALRRFIGKSFIIIILIISITIPLDLQASGGDMKGFRNFIILWMLLLIIGLIQGIWVAFKGKRNSEQ